MRYRVYIDGQEGTTGLQLQKRLSRHKDIELMLINVELRKDINARREFLNSADLVFSACRTRRLREQFPS